MPRYKDQRYAIKFCVALKKTGAETVAMLREAYGDDTMSQNMVYRWHKMFREGREDAEDDDRSGRPSTSHSDQNVTKVRDMLNSDRRLGVRMLADECNIPKSTVHRIVTEDLGMRKICAKMVPKVLSDEQKAARATISRDLLEQCERDPNFLDNVITGDETWVFEYDPESKRQSAEWHTPASPRPKKARMSKSRVKAMLIVFFDKGGIVHSEFVPRGQTVNGRFYLEVLKRLQSRVKRVRKEIANTWRLHHDNAPSHTAFIVTEYLAKRGVATLPQPPYSPDLAPPDFFLFPRIKRELKGHRFGTLDAVKAATTRCLKGVPVDAFQGAFRAWERRWRRCSDAGGGYFEEF